MIRAHDMVTLAAAVHTLVPASRFRRRRRPPARLNRHATAERQNGGESEPDPDPIPDWARAFTVRLPYPLPCRSYPNREGKFRAMPLGSFTHLPAPLTVSEKG
uniref:Uncharacterized protein n=1 Tax=Anopheles coluzzii TaxID=1518534 RepID=A0A8W7PBD3_ANOCL